MAASYPSSLFASTPINNGDTSDASQINNPVAEIIAIETGLLSGLQHNFIPLTNNTYALGNSSKRWSKLWVQDLDLAGTLTLASGLGVASGGTGATTLTNHGVLLGQGTSAIVATAVGATGLVLTGVTGADPVFQVPSVYVIDKSTTEQDHTGTTSETAVYSFSVPGGTLGTNKTLRFTLTGRYLNNTGGAVSITVKFKYGGTTFGGTSAFGGGGFSSDANAHPMVFSAVVNANGATNSQRGIVVGSYVTTAGATETDFNSAPVNMAIHSSMAVDSTANQTFTATVTLTNAGAHFYRNAAVLEVLG